MYKVKFYMKSKNIIEVNLKELNKTKVAGVVTRLSWTNATKEKQLDFIDIDEIEAIVVDEYTKARD